MNYTSTLRRPRHDRLVNTALAARGRWQDFADDWITQVDRRDRREIPTNNPVLVMGLAAMGLV
ncbi:hypothetical protein D5S17_00675 [Pseudonocardiaceae bacterium YIM PH 21723]|nr:hypothetical protein D5S17_00675 [Pseudonocardiaceae bacterium YIM PH 21723]